MSTPNNIAARPVQVLVFNSGGSPLDCSNAFQFFEGGSDDWDPTGWWRFTGTLTLAARTSVAESFDPRLNPSRWSPGNLVQISVNFGSGFVPLPFRLKILGWPARPRRGEQRIALQLGGDPELLSYRSPEGDAGGADYGTATDRKALINAVLAEAGHPLIGADTISQYPLPYSPGKNEGGSWVDFAGDIAWSAGGLLWQQGDGTVRVVNMATSGLLALPPFAHYVVGQTDSRFEPQPPTEAPPEIILVTGTGATLTPVTNDSESVTITEDGVDTTTITTYSGQGTANPSETVTVRKQRRFVLPGRSDSETMTDDSSTSRTDTYGAGGKLNTSVVLLREPLGRIHPDQDHLDEFTLADSVRTQVTIFYTASTNEVRERRTEIRRSVWGPLGPSLQVQQRTIETWRKRGSRYVYSRTTTNTTEQIDSPRISTGGSSSTTPPATQYQPAAFGRDTTDHSATITATNPTGGGYQGKLWQLTLPGGLTVSDEQCAAVGRIWATIRHGRQWPIAWAAPLTAAWLQNFSPLRRIDFTVDGVRTAYLISAWQIVLNQRTARVGGSTVELGTVAADGSGTPNPPYTIS